MGKSKGQGWHDESRRHSYARRGIKTNIDDKRRFDMSNFVARGEPKLLSRIDNPIMVTEEETDDFMDAGYNITRAYADCNNEWPKEERDLDFISEQALTPELAEQLMFDALSKNRQYNNFTPNKILRVKGLFRKPMVQLAREGSVAIYVHGKPEVGINTIRHAFEADEVRKITPTVTRIWWD